MHDKTNKMTRAPSEDSDQPGHPPSLIRVFSVRMKKAWVLSYPISAQQRLWSDWSSLFTQWVAKDPSFVHADSKDSDQTGRTCHFVGFVTRWLKYGKLSLTHLIHFSDFTETKELTWRHQHIPSHRPLSKRRRSRKMQRRQRKQWLERKKM